MVQNDFYIIDFEGEPARSLEERRAKDRRCAMSPGMLRSFDYAAGATLNKLAEQDPDGVARVRADAADWKRLVQELSWRAIARPSPAAPSWPADPAEADRLLKLFLLDKVLYEIRYEAANRPAWLRIPLAGLPNSRQPCRAEGEGPCPRLKPTSRAAARSDSPGVDLGPGRDWGAGDRCPASCRSWRSLRSAGSPSGRAAEELRHPQLPARGPAVSG